MSVKKELPIGDFTPSNYNLPDYKNGEVVKRIVRRFFYPIYNFVTTFFLAKKYQTNFFIPNLWLFGQRGNDYERHRRRVSKFISLKNKKILIAGCGKGKDIESWTAYSPKIIIGVDWFCYTRAWDLWRRYLNAVAPLTSIKFIQSDLANISNVEDNYIDVIGSDAVFEHLNNLQDTLKEFYRILVPGGVLYATFGPLWNSFGGDHVSGYDSILSGYNHLIMPPDEYDQYLNNMGDYTHSEDDGRTWIKHALFSRLKPTEYLTLIEAAGFKRLFVSAIIDPRAVECIGDSKFDRARLSHLDDLDLLVSGMTIIYRK